MNLAKKQTLLTTTATQYQPFFFSLIHQRLPYTNQADKEDILQNALLNAARTLEKWDAKKGEMKTWLGRIVLNKSTEWVRWRTTQKRDMRLETPFSYVPNDNADGESFRQEYEFIGLTDEYADKEQDELRMQLILESIAEMSPARREIIQLSYIQQLTVAEIAALKQCSYSCATSKINQATAILREKVQRKWRQLQ
jgi:RNA polymerase sigma factor (sigma-70 family)